MCELNVLVWNIGGSYSSRSYAIPAFIASTLVRKNDMDKTADIIILTEFIVAPGWCHLKAVLEEYGYSIFTSYASEQNGVLIAINKNIEGLDKKSLESAVPCTKMNTVKDKKPNFLQVAIKNDKGIPLNIVGTRIRIEREDKSSIRETQFTALYDHLNSYKDQRVICAGDFNPRCSRKKYNKDKIDYEKKRNIEGQDKWSYWWIKDKLKNSTYKIITPDDGGSWVGDNNVMYLNDHIITNSNINVSDKKYIWKFVTKENGYVKVVNDEEVELKEDDYKSHLKGYPDHAILWVKVNL